MTLPESQMGGICDGCGQYDYQLYETPEPDLDPDLLCFDCMTEHLNQKAVIHETV